MTTVLDAPTADLESEAQRLACRALCDTEAREQLTRILDGLAVTVSGILGGLCVTAPDHGMEVADPTWDALFRASIHLDQVARAVETNTWAGKP